jgi:hypothetical protein
MAKNSTLEQQLKELDRLRAKGVITDAEHETRRSAVLADPLGATAPQASGGGAKGFFKFGFFGCFGVLGAIVAVVIVIALIAAAGSSGDGDTQASGVPGAVGTNKGDVHVALAAGISGEIAPDGNKEKRTKVTILQVVDGVESTNQFSRPAAGKKWWGVEVQVENVGTKEVSSLDWKLRDSNDFEHDRTFVISGPGESLEIFYNLTPGAKQKGWVFFEIDADATAKWLRADPNPFLKNDLYFNVE